MDARRRAGVGVAGAALAVGVATGAVVTVAGGSSTVRCATYPACLVGQSTLVADVHTAGAGLLLVLAALLVALAFVARPADRPLRGLSLAALAGLAGMAAFGSLLATGQVPGALAPLQYLWLGLYCVLDAAALRRFLAGSRAPARTAGPVGADA